MGRDLCAFKVKEYASFRGQMDTWALLFSSKYCACVYVGTVFVVYYIVSLKSYKE